MDQLTSMAASGMRARMEALDMLANNLANAATSGYKADREFYNLYAAEDAQATMPLTEQPWTDHSQGTLTPTGNLLDLAISGKGFFVVEGRNGPLYTRNGNFRIARNGEVQTQEGFPVRVQGGAKLTLDPASSFEISSDGSVHQNGQEIARMELADFEKQSALQKREGNYFQLIDPRTPSRNATAEVLQGRLEAANVGTAETAVRLVGVMRQFEMLQRAITIGGEMNRRSIEEVAKVAA